MSSVTRSAHISQFPKDVVVSMAGCLRGKELVQLIKTCRFFRQTFPNGAYLNYLDFAQRVRIHNFSWTISRHAFRSGIMVKRDALLPLLRIFVQRRCIWLVRMAITSQKMTEEIRGGAAESAVINKNLAALQIILANGKISEEDRSSLVSHAILLDQSMIPLIIQSGEISDESRGKALRAAAVNGDLTLIKTILNNGTIDDVYRVTSIREAMLHGHFSCFQTLFEWSPITDKYRGGLLSRSIANRLSFIRFILASGPISHETISAAIYDAASAGILENVQEFLKWCTEKPKELHQIIITARERGHADVVAYLEAWKPEEKKSS